MKHYDIILAGGGTAGLSLAYHLLQSPLHAQTIFIVDQHLEHQNDRTWSFWTQQTTPFDDIIYRSWGQIQILNEHNTALLPLHSYRYNTIRGCDFYSFVQKELSRHSNVEFLQGNIQRIEDHDNGACLFVDKEHYSGHWVFDSRFRWPEADQMQAQCTYLKQQFKGWEIETDESAFDPQTVTFFDFRVPQEKGNSFFYILPFSSYHALVMFVAYTTTSLSWEKCDQALQSYLDTTLRIKRYRLLRAEQGATLLTDEPFPRQIGQHIMAIGTPGGRVKSSTGYAFLRIQQDSSAIVSSLLTTGHPFRVTPPARRYRFFDSALLHTMSSHKGQSLSLLNTILTQQPVERVFRFLDEVGSPWENLLMLPSLPLPLVAQMFHQANTLFRV